MFHSAPKVGLTKTKKIEVQRWRLIFTDQHKEQQTKYCKQTGRANVFNWNEWEIKYLCMNMNSRSYQRFRSHIYISHIRCSLLMIHEQQYRMNFASLHWSAIACWKWNGEISNSSKQYPVMNVSWNNLSLAWILNVWNIRNSIFFWMVSKGMVLINYDRFYDNDSIHLERYLTEWRQSSFDMTLFWCYKFIRSQTLIHHITDSISKRVNEVWICS